MEKVEILCKNPRSTDKAITEKFHQVHEMYRDRLKFGEYHHLFPLLKKYDDKFHGYIRMSYSAFTYIFKEVESKLNKAWCNLHNSPILPEEQLVITLRYAFEQLLNITILQAL